jgi:hypothetical protein
MIRSLIEAFAGCTHQRIGWPRYDRATNTTTVQCHGCQKRLLYSWREMRIVGNEPAAVGTRLEAKELI